MCGIIGAALKKGNAAEEVFYGLKRLEYRGYDSVGLSVMCGGIKTVKRGGRVDSIKGEALKLSGKTAIGHTRWATHGAATNANAHPHVSGKFALVHNGIIENYDILKEELLKEGYSFSSETDSEVIVKLIDKFYKGDFLAAVASAVKLLKGSFALAVMCEGEEGFVAVKYKNPIVIGFGKEGVYACSDLPALPSSVTSVCVPEDGDIIRVTSTFAKFYDFSLNGVTRVRAPASLKGEASEKGDYAHYMLKEINEEAATVKLTAESFLRGVDLKKLCRILEGADKIIAFGCGTAYNAALAARRFFKREVTVEIASELRYFMPEVTTSTVALAVTQSGETADTVEAALALKSAGAKVIAITNCGYSAITRVAHAVLPVCAGAEICVAATKSYSGQLAALYLLANISNDLFTAESRLLSTCKKIEVTVKKDFTSAAQSCAKSSAVFFLGRGADYAVAVEASLKLKEITYIFSEGYPSGELKHGTLALIDKDTLSVFIITDEALRHKNENAVEQVLSRGGRAIVITTLPTCGEGLKGRAEIILLPSCEASLSPFITSAACQLIAYLTAVELGRDPDKPRNLAKSVTVE